MFAFSRFLKDLGTIRKAILLALTLFVLGECSAGSAPAVCRSCLNSSSKG